jgi:23S rRNA A1618 N6-methylase RlmF
MKMKVQARYCGYRICSSKKLIVLYFVGIHHRKAIAVCIYPLLGINLYSSMKFSGREPTKFVKITTETLSFG